MAFLYSWLLLNIFLLWNMFIQCYDIINRQECFVKPRLCSVQYTNVLACILHIPQATYLPVHQQVLAEKSACYTYILCKKKTPKKSQLISPLMKTFIETFLYK